MSNKPYDQEYPLFSIVILHYKTISDTIVCVNSILEKIIYPNYKIIIIDNGSNDGSDVRLFDKYNHAPNIHIIINEKNLGFSKGNNVGFKYAKETLNSKFIVVLNNDTYIEQTDFLDKILDRYQISEFHIMGPDIISPYDYSHQNPVNDALNYNNPGDYQRIRLILKHLRFRLILNYFLVDRILLNLKKSIWPKSRIQHFDNTGFDFSKEIFNVKLHGSCIIFSPDFVKNYSGFYPETFMYGEESILSFIAERDNLITLYYPEIKIFHNEGSTINKVFKQDARKRRFHYKNEINSIKIFLDLIKKQS
jgi:GT2 family glycosyltransferase